MFSVPRGVVKVFQGRDAEARAGGAGVGGRGWGGGRDADAAAAHAPAHHMCGTRTHLIV